MDRQLGTKNQLGTMTKFIQGVFLESDECSVNPILSPE